MIILFILFYVESWKNKKINFKSAFLCVAHCYQLSVKYQQVKHILYKNFNLVTYDDETADIFQSLPLMAYIHNQNIKEILIRTKLPSTTERSGTTPCKHPQCCTCTHINHSTTITNNNNSFHINANFTCSSACLVYCISCKQCDMIYIGKTVLYYYNLFHSFYYHITTYFTSYSIPYSARIILITYLSFEITLQIY